MSKGVGTALGLLAAGVGTYFLVKNAVDLGTGIATDHNQSDIICTCGGSSDQCIKHDKDNNEFDIDMGESEIDPVQFGSDSSRNTGVRESSVNSYENDHTRRNIQTYDTNVHTYDAHTTDKIGQLIMQEKVGKDIATNEDDKRALMASLVNSAASTHNHASIREHSLIETACKEILAPNDADNTSGGEKRVVHRSEENQGVRARVNALAVIANMAVNSANVEELQQAVGVVGALLEKVADRVNETSMLKDTEILSATTHTDTTTTPHSKINVHTHAHAREVSDTFPTHNEIPIVTSQAVTLNEDRHMDVASPTILYTPSDAEAVMALKAALNLSSCEEHHSTLIARKIPECVVKFMSCDVLESLHKPHAHTHTHTQQYTSRDQLSPIIASGVTDCHYTAECRAQACRVAVNLSTSTAGALALVRAGIVPCLVGMLKVHKDDEELDSLRRLLVCLYNCVQGVITMRSVGRGEQGDLEGTIDSESGSTCVILRGRDEVYEICRMLAKRGNDDERRAEKVLELLQSVQDVDL